MRAVRGRTILVAMTIAALMPVLAPGAARADVPPPQLPASAPPPATRPAPAAHLTLVPAVGLRLGLAGEPVGTGDASLAPSLGAVVALGLGPYLCAHLAWDATFLSGGTSAVSVRSVTHGLSLVAEGRLVLHGAVAVVAGLGPGLALDVVTRRAPAGSVTTVTLRPGLVWDAGLDLGAGHFDLRLGVEGRLDRLGHQVGFLVGVRYRLHTTGN